ncbi:MAG: hypothetical protein IJ601_10015 [Acidaminococcaceae bacterium]|nr:hypothetical protein [Acidaminococcaceae bacterium]
MGVLGKDLFDFDRPRTHTKVWFGADGYWLENNQWRKYPYGTILTELLDYDAGQYHRRAEALRTAMAAGKLSAVAQRYRALGKAFKQLPLYNRVLVRTGLDSIVSQEEQNISDKVLGEQVLSGKQPTERYFWADDDLRQIETVYKPFLLRLFDGVVSEKKKGQRKISLAQQLLNHGLEAYVSGVSLGTGEGVDPAPTNVQYAVLETGERGNTTAELVEKMYFDRLIDFVYVELMKGLQKGFVPKLCPNCGKWFLQQPGMTYSYCDRVAPGETELTCRDIGAKTSFRELVKNNEIWKIHQRAYKKYFARTRKGTMSKAEFEVWAREAEMLRDAALKDYESARSEAQRGEIAQVFADRLNRA